MTRFSLCAAAGLLLAFLLMPPASADPTAAPDTPAVAVVRAFLADRAAGKYADAYALLSEASQQGMTAAQFAAGGPPSAADKTMPNALFDVSALFFDPQNTSGCTFTVTGPDPADPRIVRVQVSHPSAPVANVRILTLRDPQTGTQRLDLLGSLRQTAPTQTAAMLQSTAQALSQSHLKQLRISILLYAQAHDETLPDATRWTDEILPYVKSIAVFHDPASPPGHPWSYAYNLALSHRSIARLKLPAQTVLLFESAKGLKNASDTGQSVPHPGRHAGGTDYLFADGHVKWLKDGIRPSYRLDGK